MWFFFWCHQIVLGSLSLRHNELPVSLTHIHTTHNMLAILPLLSISLSLSLSLSFSQTHYVCQSLCHRFRYQDFDAVVIVSVTKTLTLLLASL
jgi:hypothetical protein